MILTLDDILKIYPWEEKYLKIKQSRLDWLWTFDLNISVDSLWPLISDTSRLNRAMGLSAMDFQEKDGLLYGKTKNAGILLEWVEIPWTWSYATHLISIREYSKGYASLVKVIYHLEKISDNSLRLYIYLGWVPKNFFYRLFLNATEKIIFKKYESTVNEMVQFSKSKNNITSSFSVREKESMIQNQLTLNKIKTELASKAIDQSLVDRLIDHIEFSNELDLSKIRVLELAKKWEVNPRELVKVAMYATQAGLLTISWDSICPHCRGSRLEGGSLYEVPAKGSCDVCEIDFDNDMENSIEITFHVHPTFRLIGKVFYCSAEPAKKPHIKFQKYLQPSEILESNLILGEGEYTYRIKGNKDIGNLIISESNSEKIINWSILEKQNLQANENPSIRIENNDSIPHLFIIEEKSWDPFILKPSFLFSLHEFHELFSSESISSELKLELGLQTILFTDIVGSSTLYENYGDSKTFVHVKKHFEEINNVVNKNDGAIIKTIGDAVMATFPSPKGAIQAAISLREIFSGVAANDIKLRISIHYGHCIAVNLNSGIDYFGKTVNIAAKIQKLAGASQIVFTKEYGVDPEVQSFISDNKIKLEEIKYSIPGMKDEYMIYRIDA